MDVSVNAREEIDEEGVLIWAVLGKIGGDDARGRVPRRLPPPLRQEEVLEVDRSRAAGKSKACDSQACRLIRPFCIMLLY